MRLPVLLAGLVACGGGTTQTPATVVSVASESKLADENNFVPAYGKAELSKALIAERGKEATDERKLAELEAKGDDATFAQADLAVRRRFITALEACEASGSLCPPRLDEPAWSFEIDTKDAKPSLDSPLRFDVDSWRKLAAELHGRACACRTIACVDGVGVAIDQLELRPMQDVQGDEVASESITRARECLFRLRGKR